MKVIIFSDNHGKVSTLTDIRKRHPEISIFIHCGDYCSSVDDSWMIRVAGNNDYDDCDEIKIINIDGKRILITHGHLFPRYKLVDSLYQYALKNHCDIVCFGHIHVRVLEEKNGILIINPGSTNYNYDGSQCGYAILDTENNQVEFKYI